MDKQTPYGLTLQEVEQLTKEGKTNAVVKAHTKSVRRIVSENLFTLFNAVNAVLALLIFWTGKYQNLLFVGVVLANLAIAIFQELRAKYLLDRLRLQVPERYTVFREGREETVAREELLLHDTVLLKRGDTVPCDLNIAQGSVMVNESLLTGESEPLLRTCGAQLISGSYITQGSCYATCEVVGKDTTLSKMNNETKRFVQHKSPIYLQLSFIIRICSFVLVPLGALLFASYLAEAHDAQEAVLSSAGAMIGMIPQGLVLLASTVFAVSAQLLARKKVLLQNLYATDLMSSLTMLVLDKTGTITTGNLRLEQLMDAKGNALSAKTESTHPLIRGLQSIVSANKDDANETMRAIEKALPNAGKTPRVRERIAFSSEIKYSGCVLEDGRSFLLGAPGYLGLSRAAESALLKKLDTKKRILFVVERSEHKTILLGALQLEDSLRPQIVSTVRALIKSHVGIKVVSGDAPKAVQAAAEAAEIPHAERVCDLSRITCARELEEAANTYSVFARALPAQKQQLLHLWKAPNNTVGMVGDGVNDVSALKEANVAVSFAQASQAAQAVADVLLLTNDFSTVAAIIQKGRVTLNNLASSASLFLEKTMLSMALALLCIFFPPFLFVPVQLSLLSATCIGIPSFVIGLWQSANVRAGAFLERALLHAIPAAASIFCGSAALIALRTFGFAFQSESLLETAAVILYFFVGSALVFVEAKALKRLRICLVACIVIAFGVAIRVAPHFFGLSFGLAYENVFLICISLCALCLFAILCSKVDADAPSIHGLRHWLCRISAAAKRERA